MPTSATGRSTSRPRDGGFTLLELLVVVVLAGIVVATATLSVGRREVDRPVAIEARRLAGLLELMRDEALLQGARRGLRFEPDGYRFLQGDGEGGWSEIEDEGLYRARRLPAGVRAEVTVEGSPVALDDASSELEPHARWFASGEATPLAVTFSAPNDGQSRRVAVDILGQVEVDTAP